MGEAKRRKAEIEAIKARAKEDMQKLVTEFEAIGFKWNFEGEKKDRQKLGQFATPPVLAVEMTSRFGRYDIPKSTIDPACGYGALLLMKMLYDVRINKLEPVPVFLNTYGNDISPECIDVCKKNFRKFARHFNIEEHVVDFVLETHFSCEDATTERAYKGQERAVKWLLDHKKPCVMKANGIILAVAGDKPFDPSGYHEVPYHQD